MYRIRAEVPSDHRRVFEIQEAAFGGSYEPRLVEALRASASPQLSLVAEDEGRVVGHVFFSPVTIASQPDGLRCAALGPIAIEPARQRQGLGSALVRHGLERCAEHAWSAVFLVGDPGYYARFGFVPAVPLGFRYPDPRFDAALQVYERIRGALAQARGTVHYHAAFAELEET